MAVLNVCAENADYAMLWPKRKLHHLLIVRGEREGSLTIWPLCQLGGLLFAILRLLFEVVPASVLLSSIIVSVRILSYSWYIPRSSEIPQSRWKLSFSFFFLTCAPVTQVAKVSILDKLAPNITLQAQIDERRCICIKQQGSDRGEYKPVCGQCRDPCALRFIPRNSVEYLQKLTLGENAVSEVPAYWKLFYHIHSYIEYWKQST